jgi:hypothetical protein
MIKLIYMTHVDNNHDLGTDEIEVRSMCVDGDELIATFPYDNADPSSVLLAAQLAYEVVKAKEETEEFVFLPSLGEGYARNLTVDEILEREG